MGGDIPKQYQALGGKSILRSSVESFLRIEDVHSLRVVIDKDAQDHYAKALGGLDLPPVHGGKTRQESVYNGLKALSQIAKPDDIVLIHDAARPFVKEDDITRLIEALLGGAKAATLYAPVADTLFDEQSGNYPDRSALKAIQTPQGFHYGTLLKAYERFSANLHDFTDDTSLAAAAGEAVNYIEGKKSNFKITTQDDMNSARKLIVAEMITRTGLGFDVHAFSEEPASSIRLGGIDIPHTKSLKGHSDADVALHTITDALLGAIAAGDIGDHFPPSDNTFKGMDSAIFLEKAADLVREKGGEIMNIDLTIMCEAPKLFAYKAPMAARIAEILRLKPSQIGVKATTTEKLGFTGRGEGIAAQAVATVRVPAP